jgi:hypothetical protein
MLAHSQIVDSIFGLLSLLQGSISLACFGQPLTAFHLAGGIMQTYGYFLICMASEPAHALVIERGSLPLFGSIQEGAGLFFAAVALVLQCLSITMTEALSSNVKLTVGELLRGNGFIGLGLTFVYHLIVLTTKTEQLVLLVSNREITVFALVFVAAAGCQQYSACWLVLNTRAVEYARVVIFASVVFIGLRHAIYKEDGAAYGFYQVPPIGALATVIGLALISFTPPVLAPRRLSESRRSFDA